MRKGIWYALGAYVTWGLFPIYWKLLKNVPPLQLLSHRILWSFLLLAGIMLALRQVKVFRGAINGRVLLIYFAAAILIAINWLTYVWAVGAGYLVETSLGYFIYPLLSVFIGVVLLKERLRPFQWFSIGLAAAGVIYLTIAHGTLPWVALTLAISFAFYGLVKKTAPLNALQGLTLETGLLFLPALGFLVLLQLQGKGTFLHSSAVTDLMLVGAGAVTVMPLLLFGSAAPRISLTMIGVLQYINPTLQFLLGVFIFREPFDHHRLIGFGIVWIALVFFGIEGFAYQRMTRAAIRVG